VTHGVYAGSFDPITNGHVWMIEQGRRLFDRLTVAVANNPDKRYAFDYEKRIRLVQSVCERSGGEVAWIGSSFLVDYAKMVDATHLLRGIRNASDAEYERAMRNVNGDHAPRVQTVFLMPPRELCEVSSSMVKGLVGPEGWEKVVERYVPGATLQALREMAAK
jgi:pantetheine-phosphate adenylyltransferase